jgi:hypothetical protein
MGDLRLSIRFECATGVLAAAFMSGCVADAQAPRPEEIIPKATSYVHQFVERFSNVVAEERYEQRITSPRRTRVLISDFLLVRYTTDEVWQAFRDVAQVDGKPVRDRQDRMMKLFLEPSASALKRAREIMEAGARYNLAEIGAVNNPLLAMAFLQRHYVDRFRFTVAGLDEKLGPGVRTVRFVEFRLPPLLSGNENVFSSGLLWIEESTGRVVKTELQLGTTSSPVRITTTYSFDEDLGINVPVMMEDWYAQGTGEFVGKATYGKFRRFQVKIEEAVQR